MYSLSTRANAVFFFFIICLVILCIFNIATTIFQTQKPTVHKFEIEKFTSLYYHPYTKVQHSVGLIDMDIDFSPCFNWNSNLVFAWVSATYKTGKQNLTTSVTVYDKIMLRSNSKSHQIVFNKKSFEYPLIDTYKTLEGKEVTFELHWEHMPVVGPILKHKIALGKYTLPSKTTQNYSQTVLRREIDYYDEEEEF